MKIQAVDRALDVLILLSEKGDFMGVSDIAKTLGLPKTTAFRTLESLEERGFVQKDSADEKYWLGMKMYSIGMGMKDKISIRKIIQPYSQMLHREFSEVINVSVLDNSDPTNPLSVIIEQVVGQNQRLRVNPVEGSATSCVGSSVGKCLLAYGDVNLQLLDPARLIRYTHKSITSMDAMLEEIENVRIRGYAIDDEEVEIGLTCISAPIFGRDGKIVAAMSISGPTQRMRDGDFDKKIARLREVAKLAGMEFGANR